MVKYLVEHERWCGYVEDPNSMTAQGSPGIGCEYLYKDPMVPTGLASEKVDWVNYAEDPASLPLGGPRKELSLPLPSREPLTFEDD